MPEPISTMIAGTVLKTVATKAITSVTGKVFTIPVYKETLAKTIDKSIDETSNIFEWNGSQRIVSIFRIFMVIYANFHQSAKRETKI